MGTVTRSIRLACVLVVVAMLGHSAAVRAETLADVEKFIGDKWDKLKSASYDMEMSSNNEGQGYSMKMTSAGKSEVMRDGDKVKIHMETKTTNNMVAAGNTTKTEMLSTMVVDGEFAYTMMDNSGQKSVMKTKAQSFSDGAGGKGFLKMLKEHSELALLPDETVDGNATYVIEGKAKGAAAGGQNSKYYFSKENGMVIQSVSGSADGKAKTTMKITNIKIDPAIAADRFTFTAPAGVQVTDMTKQ